VRDRRVRQTLSRPSDGIANAEEEDMSGLEFSAGREFARHLDQEDELASFREAFVFPEADLVYLDGNSLGRLPGRTVERMRTAVEEEWGRDLIRGWNAGWWDSSRRVGDKIGLLLGAAPGQVVVSDTTSINLFKLVMAALGMRPGRSRIVSDVLNFPSDLYVLQGCVRLLGDAHHIQLVPSDDGVTVEQSALFDAIDDQTALVTLSHVVFKSGFLYDAQAVTERAHEVGAMVLWDLGHSAGVVPIELDRWNVDLAVGCTYKYLNGGPGAPAYLYVRGDLQEQAVSPIWGWFGQRSPFDFELEYEPADGISRFLVSSPPILSTLAMEAGLGILEEAGIERIRRKSVLLTSYLVYLVETSLLPLGFALGSPREASQRGSHVSIRHREGYRINRVLTEEMGVLPDFREPDNIRLGLSPLYTSFAEVWEAVDRIKRVAQEKQYLRYFPGSRSTVT
jgi:kynureninase